MLSRKLGINWRYATGEISIIVVGVLIAITLDNCNDARIARTLEREYLARLAEDLKADTATSVFIGRVLDRKERGLASVDSVVNRGAVLRDTLTFLQTLVSSANFAWNVPRVRTTTFQELQSTGNLRLLRDPDLRAHVVDYYGSAEGDYLRMQGRRTRYGPLSYELVPRKGEFVIDSTRARLEARPLVEAIMRSDLHAATIAERNFATFVGELNAGRKRRSRELLDRIEPRK